MSLPDEQAIERAGTAAKLVTALSPLSQSAARPLLICAAAASVAILTVRAAIGPFSLWGFHTRVNSPFTAESIFWIAILGLLCLPRRATRVQIPNDDTTGFPRAYLAVALSCIALAFVHNLADPFLSDDYIILSGPSFHWQSFLAALHTPGGDGSFRPLGTVYYQIVRTFAGADPVQWHLMSLGLHLLDSALVYILAWRLWRNKTASGVASLVFGLHGTRPEAALWTAGACDLLACACVLGSIVLALGRPLRPLPLTASLLLVAAGILFKESAYAAPLIAFCILWPTGRSRDSRAFLIGSIAICATLFAWRWHLFHGPGGYIDPATGRPAILSLHLLTAAKAVFLRIWDILLVPVNWDAPSSWWLPLALFAWMSGVVLLAATRVRHGQLWLAAATCCAVLPAIHLALIGQSELGSRILYLPAATFALLIGSLGAGNVGPAFPLPPSRGVKRGVILSVIMLTGMGGILEHNLTAWHSNALKARALCHAPFAQPDQSVPGAVDGVFLFQNGFPECVAAARK